ncbi:MAG: DUF3108 domain-containing protein [Muribaculaceae bacterium]|nr:DUF3108 domain-containing protein [Muribaculaceae bacterium]
MMKKIIFLFALIFISTVAAFATTNEKLNYVVTYKWGLIQKDAGEVEITKKPKNDGYELKLVAKTKPWADKIYKLRDTLISVTEKEHYRPLHYTYIAHEKNKYRKDDIAFTYTGNSVKGKSEKYKENKNGDIEHSSQILEGSTPVYDMLSVYFFLRDIEYANLKPGETVRATIFSGSKEEFLTVRCEGKETIQLRDKSEHEAWHILFKFTQKGGTKSSDDINCWVSTKEPHIPLLIVGNLPIGQVRVNYQAP